jgi:hypothetical protein
MKRKHLSSFLDGFGCDTLFLSIVSEVLYEALRDRVTDLLVTPFEFEILNKWFIHSAQWNWDKKTFMGMNFVVTEN